MSLKSVINYAGWPAATGFLGALTILLLLPHLQNLKPEQNSEPHSFILNSLSPHTTHQWEGPVSYSEAVKQAAPAVVSILTRKRLKPQNEWFNDPLFRHFFNKSNIPQQERMQSALGSGVIVSDEGYLLTNDHVIDGAQEIMVLLRDGREARASLVGTDPRSDLAVLKINLDNLTSIHIGTPDDAQVGDVVLAIGNPFGVGQTVTQGIISATGRDGINVGLSELETNYIQTDAAINPGNSGGALTDAYGNLLGINTAIIDRANGSLKVGIGFAIPVDTAMKVLRDIIDVGHVVRGWLGIEAQELTPKLAQSFSLDSTNGFIIIAIYNDGPAHRAGLLPGDIITHINQQPVINGRLGMVQIAESRPGDQVAIEVLRNGKSHTIEATIGTMPVAG